MAIEIVSFPIKNGWIFHSYVSLLEGILKRCWIPHDPRRSRSYPFTCPGRDKDGQLPRSATSHPNVEGRGPRLVPRTLAARRHRQISGEISGPALGETTSDISLPKCKKLVHYGSFTIIYIFIPSYENILSTALTGPKYVEIPHYTRLSGECLILGRDYSELVHFTREFSPCLRKPKSCCQGDPESTLPDDQVL